MIVSTVGGGWRCKQRSEEYAALSPGTFIPARGHSRRAAYGGTTSGNGGYGAGADEGEGMVAICIKIDEFLY